MKKYEYKVIKTTNKTDQKKQVLSNSNNLEQEGWELVKTSKKLFKPFQEEEIIYTYKRELISKF